MIQLVLGLKLSNVKQSLKSFIPPSPFPPPSSSYVYTGLIQTPLPLLTPSTVFMFQQDWLKPVSD